MNAIQITPHRVKPAADPKLVRARFGRSLAARTLRGAKLRREPASRFAPSR